MADKTELTKDEILKVKNLFKDRKLDKSINIYLPTFTIQNSAENKMLIRKLVDIGIGSYDKKTRTVIFEKDSFTNIINS